MVTKKSQEPEEEKRLLKRGDVCVLNNRRVIILTDQGDYGYYIHVLTEEGTKRNPAIRELEYLYPLKGVIPEGYRYKITYSWEGVESGKGQASTILSIPEGGTLRDFLTDWLGKTPHCSDLTGLQVKQVSAFPEEALQ